MQTVLAAPTSTAYQWFKSFVSPLISGRSFLFAGCLSSAKVWRRGGWHILPTAAFIFSICSIQCVPEIRCPPASPAPALIRATSSQTSITTTGVRSAISAVFPKPKGSATGAST